METFASRGLHRFIVFIVFIVLQEEFLESMESHPASFVKRTKKGSPFHRFSFQNNGAAMTPDDHLKPLPRNDENGENDETVLVSLGEIQ
jgi:hypothetical protein